EREAPAGNGVAAAVLAGEIDRTVPAAERVVEVELRAIVPLVEDRALAEALAAGERGEGLDAIGERLARRERHRVAEAAAIRRVVVIARDAPEDSVRHGIEVARRPVLPLGLEAARDTP